MSWKRLRAVAAVTASLLVVAAAVAAWIGSVAVTLARLDVRLADDCARVEAASRARLELARNLVESSRMLDSADESRLRPIERLLEEASDETLSPELVHARGPLEGFSETQRSLSELLDAYWNEMDRGRRPGAAVIADDLEPRLEEATARLDQALRRLGESIRSYREETRRFPASIVDGLIRDGSEPTDRPRVPRLADRPPGGGPSS